MSRASTSIFPSRKSVSAPEQADQATERTIWVALSLVPLVYASAFPALRQFGEIPLLLALLCAGLATFGGRTKPIPADYLLFLAFSTLILTMSLLGLMPTAWTQYRDQFAAIRQWIYVPGLLVISGAFYILFSKYYAFSFKNALKLVIFFLLVSQISRTMTDIDYFDIANRVLYNFTNDNTFIALALFVLIFRRERNIFLDIFAIFLLMASSFSSQSMLLWLVVAAIRVVRHPMRLVWLVFIACLGFIVIAPFFVLELAVLDHNTGVRAVLWRDTWHAIVQTNGVGVGYGTEFIRNDFSSIMLPLWSLTTPTDRLFVATHSTFYDVLLREGITGMCIFLFWFVRNLRPARKMTLNSERILASTLVLLIISNSINVGASSINFLFGTAACIAFASVVRLKGRIEDDTGHDMDASRKTGN